MTKRDKLFLTLWGMMIFPLTVIYLNLHFGLSEKMCEMVLGYGGVIKAGYAGLIWNDTRRAAKDISGV